MCPLKPFLCVEQMAEKKQVTPRFVTSASRRVFILRFRKENPGSPSEEEMDWGVWNEKKGEVFRDNESRERGREREKQGEGEMKERERCRERQTDREVEAASGSPVTG